jgi:hypothetical protein
MDALILFEACLEGRLNHVPRRPHDREREDLIRSGHVFIYEEHSSGIKRWTDGYNWSPSRILGNFLIYRELEKAFPPGEKKKAIKKKNKPVGIAKTDSGRPASANVGAMASALGMNSSDNQSDAQRALIGSLVDSYPFKEDGLVKKTISVHWNGVPHHLVSYYRVEDVTGGLLSTPSRCEQFRSVVPRSGLISSQNFRVPVDQEEYNFENDQRPYFLFQNPQLTADYGVPLSLPRSMSVPSVNMGMPFPTSTHYALPPQMQSPLGGLASNVTGGHYASYGQSNVNVFDPVRSTPPRHASVATGLSNDFTRTLAVSPMRRPSLASFDPMATTSAAADSLVSPLAMNEPRSYIGVGSDSFLGQDVFHRPSLPSGHGDVLGLDQARSVPANLMSPPMSQAMGIDEESRSWTYPEYTNAHSQYIGGSPAWPASEPIHTR